ncbi:MAG TPA: phosphate ABC transporter ATP-binding protein PstB [Baekduia sp.]|nr:phosphate ABC transporter ATP-binding protein PstB [Baekduia sp.]
MSNEISVPAAGTRPPASLGPIASADRSQTHANGSLGATNTGHRLSVENLVAHYGDNKAVRDITLTYEPNHVTAMIGPSGCGKSTVLRCLNRMHEAIPGARVEGLVKLDDVDIYARGVNPVVVRQAIGMVFQKPNPFPTMSIFDNVVSGLKLTHRRGVNLRERAEQSLRGAGLWDEVKDRLGKPGMSLSGGQQQRLCIARTIAVEPDIILMDEPCSALDPVATMKIEELVSELKQRFTIVIVTHNMQQAARVADSTAFFLMGELVEHAPTREIFSSPGDERTEQYVTGKFG